MANTAHTPTQSYSPLGNEHQNDLPPPYTTSDQPPTYSTTDADHDVAGRTSPPTTNPSYAYTPPSTYTLPSAPAAAYITSPSHQDVYSNTTDIERAARWTAVRQVATRRSGRRGFASCCCAFVAVVMLIGIGIVVDVVTTRSRARGERGAEGGVIG
jgi:hypothetical protein